MPFFSAAPAPNPELEAEIVRVTSELQTELKWDVVLSLCDKLAAVGSKACVDVVKILQKRLNNTNPHVVLLTIELLDALMKNAGPAFQKEACNLSFVKELKAVAMCSKTRVAEEMRKKIKRWAEHECKEDPALNLMPTLYYELRGDGYEFPVEKSVKKAVTTTNPDYVSSVEEADQIAAAIQASLKSEAGAIGGGQSLSSDRSRQFGQTNVSASPSALYPTNSVVLGTGPSKERRVVKALYDFEAAEENELTFKAGDMITLMDDSDMNWWKGSTSNDEGLFPSSFVTADLGAQVEGEQAGGSGRKVQFDENVQVKEVEPAPKVVVVDEDKLNKCLELLEDADPTGERPDPEELLQLEAECLSMGPLIDAELANIDGQHNTLAEVDVKIREALQLYDQAMNEASAQFRAQQMQAAHAQQLPQATMGPVAGGMLQNYQQGYSIPVTSDMTNYGYAPNVYNSATTMPIQQQTQQQDPSVQYTYPPNHGIPQQQYVQYNAE